MNNGDIQVEVEAIEAIVSYKFNDTSLLLSALTRRSYWHENRATCQEHNERMEYLGDAVLGLIVAHLLYSEFPEDEEGELQKKRASLVKRSALAQLTRRLDLARFIRMGRGDHISGCRDRDSILADTLEAVIAAIYLDGGFEKAWDTIEKRFYPMLRESVKRSRADDFKSALQESAQAHFGITPHYQVLNQWGEEHEKTFTVAVFLNDEIAGEGTGRNKKEAAQNAARAALEALQVCESHDQGAPN